jgi:hypothetical protein
MRSGNMSRISGEPGEKKLSNDQYEIDLDPARSGSVFGINPNLNANKTNNSLAFGAKKSLNV